MSVNLIVFFSTTDRNTRTDQVFTEERTETHHLTKDVDTVDFNIDQENINARIKKEEKDKTELIVVVQFLMAHKYDLDNDIHELKKTLRDLQKQQNENQSRLVKNNKKPADQESLKFDKINEEETTNFKTMKKNIEKEIDEKETQINSVSYVVDVIAKKKNELEDTIKKTQTQRENSEA